MKNRIDWDAAPMVVIPAKPIAPCPKCYCRDHVFVRAMGEQGDGARLRRVICSKCSTPFKIMVDPSADAIEFICQ